MADRPRRESKIPKRYSDEVSDSRPNIKKKSERPDKDLYEIEIKEVDRVANKVKIHFTGYSDKYDEWRPYDGASLPIVRLQRTFSPSDISLNDRLEIFHDRLYREIKRKLYSGRKEDPEVRIELSLEEDVFQEGIAVAGSKHMERNREVYRLRSNRDLDSCLGVKWDERIMNENGDFAFVITGTVRYWIKRKAPIVEYRLIGGKFVRNEIEDGFQLILTFVRGDGNQEEYKNRNSNE